MMPLNCQTQYSWHCSVLPSLYVPIRTSYSLPDTTGYDSALLANTDECLRNVLQARVQSVNQVLFGWFTIPDAVEVPLDFNINPLGNRMRSEKRVWNDGKQRLKLVQLHTRPRISSRPCIEAKLPHDALSDGPLSSGHSCRKLRRASAALPSFSVSISSCCHDEMHACHARTHTYTHAQRWLRFAALLLPSYECSVVSGDTGTEGNQEATEGPRPRQAEEEHTACCINADAQAMSSTMQQALWYSDAFLCFTVVRSTSFQPFRALHLPRDVAHRPWKTSWDPQHSRVTCCQFRSRERGAAAICRLPFDIRSQLML